MGSRGRMTKLLVVAAGVAALVGVAGTPPPVNAAQPEPAGQDAVDQPRTVTLLTGDQVVVSGRTHSTVPAKGRENVTFHGSESGGHLYVMPSDAVSAVGSGRLDRRLFDITTLLRFGYDDASRADLPLIVTGAPGTAVMSAGPGIQVDRELPSVSGTAVRVGKANAAETWAGLVGQEGVLAAGSTKIWLDGKLTPSLDESVPLVGAPSAWQAGFTGKGMTIAVLDSGIDAEHPDFAGRITEARNFTSAPDADDVNEHGTHVASTIAGSGAASGGKYRGVAPDANLLVGKVCEEDGCPESSIIDGFEWAAAEMKARVVSFSVGGPDTPEESPTEQAVNRLTAEHGTLFVIAAGNEGPEPGTVGSPSSAPAALSVASVDKRNVPAEYSSRGPRVGGGPIKPEIAAPGSDIVAARARNGVIGRPVDDSYTRLSGTSMATPHVAGGAILLAQQHPDWRAGELKSALVGSAVPTAKPEMFTEGAGRLDLARAVASPVYTTPSTVDLGMQRWPHSDSQRLTGTVTYHNTGSQPVTLTLSVSASGPAGKPAPAGAFTVDRTEVTVPAGGETPVAVAAALGRGGQIGDYTARLVATNAGTRVGTPIVAAKERESYDLTVRVTRRDGKPGPLYSTTLYDLQTGGTETPTGSDGVTTLRRPRGRYLLSSSIEDGATTTLLNQPLVDLTRNTTVHLDARTAKPVDIRVPEASARPTTRIVGFRRYFDGPDGRTFHESYATISGDGGTVYTGHFGPRLSPADMVAFFSYKFGEPQAQGGFQDSRYIYHLLWTEPGRYTTGFRREVRRHELAAVQQHYHATAEVRYQFSTTIGSVGEVEPTVAVILGTRLPFTRTEYHLADGPRWRQEFFQTGSQNSNLRQTQLYGPLETFRAGRSYERHWNQAVFGPGFRADQPRWSNIRQGDSINVHVPTYTDAGDGRYGYPTDGTKDGSITLYRNGKLVGTSDDPTSGKFTVPAGAGTYRLEQVRQLNEKILPLSSRMSRTWTFRSAHVPQDRTEPLPLLAVKIAAPVDEYNRGRAGRLALVPIAVERPYGVPETRITELTVQLSGDDGATWYPATTFRIGHLWYAVLVNPDRGEFASLRATATDRAGNKVEQTSIKAYRLKS